MCFSCATDIILSQASHYVKHFLIIISLGKGDAPKVGRYLIFMTLSLRVGCERFKRTFYLQQLKSQIELLWCVVCIPSSRQLKKYKIFVLPGRISGNIFMPPIVAFHEIPLVLRLQVLSVAGRLYSNLYIL